MKNSTCSKNNDVMERKANERSLNYFQFKPYQTINILPREKHKRIQSKRHATNVFTFKVFKYNTG